MIDDMLILFFKGDLYTVEPWLVQKEWEAWADPKVTIKVECASLNHLNDRCSTNPCLNGQCIEASNNYYCLCQPNWQGKNCDQESK